MRFQESSPVLSTPDIILIRNKATAGRSGQEKENELYLLLKTWIFLGGAVEDGLACVIIWKFKVDPFQATMVPNGVYVPLFQQPTQHMIGLKSELKYYFSLTVVYDGT